MTEELVITRATARKLVDAMPDTDELPGPVAWFFDTLMLHLDEAQAEAGDDTAKGVSFEITVTGSPIE